jgi:hypothetical protein
LKPEPQPPRRRLRRLHRALQMKVRPRSQRHKLKQTPWRPHLLYLPAHRPPMSPCPFSTLPALSGVSHQPSVCTSGVMAMLTLHRFGSSCRSSYSRIDIACGRGSLLPARAHMGLSRQLPVLQLRPMYGQRERYGRLLRDQSPLHLSRASRAAHIGTGIEDQRRAADAAASPRPNLIFKMRTGRCSPSRSLDARAMG